MQQMNRRGVEVLDPTAFIVRRELGRRPQANTEDEHKRVKGRIQRQFGPNFLTNASNG